MSQPAVSSASQNQRGHASAGGVSFAFWNHPKVIGWGAVFIAFLVWEVLAKMFGVSPLYLPRPTQIVVALFDMFYSGDLIVDLVMTLYRIFAGFALAAICGTLLGIAIAMSWRTRAIADIFIAALYPLPKVTLIPLLIIWFGTGGPFMLATSFLGAIFPIVVNTALGVKQVDPGLVLAARDLGASTSQIVRWVLLPASVPSIFTGFRLGLGVSIILVVAAEMVVGKLGLGARLFLSGQILETEQVFAVLVVLALLGIVVSAVQDAVDARLARWQGD